MHQGFIGSHTVSCHGAATLFPESISPGELQLPTVELARRLCGMLLLEVGMESEGRTVPKCGGLIIETEAYLHDDAASHSFRGETGRNKAMFMAAGTIYVYRSYGIHHCVNLVSGPEGLGEAVLIRSLLPLVGIQTMIGRRFGTHGNAAVGVSGLSVARLRTLTRGPGNLCKALNIDMSLNGCQLGEAKQGIFPQRALLLAHPRGKGEETIEHGRMQVFAEEKLPGLIDLKTALATELMCSRRTGISKNREADLRFYLKLGSLISPGARGRKAG